MTSNIDPTHPATGTAYTQNVRNNFQAAYDEINALQAAVATLETESGGVLGLVTGLDLSVEADTPITMPAGGYVITGVYILSTDTISDGVAALYAQPNGAGSYMALLNVTITPPNGVTAAVAPNIENPNRTEQTLYFNNTTAAGNSPSTAPAMVSVYVLGFLLSATVGSSGGYQAGPGLKIDSTTSPPTIDVVTPYLPISGGTVTGGLIVTGTTTLSGATAPTPALSDNSSAIATTAFVAAHITALQTQVTTLQAQVTRLMAQQMAANSVNAANPPDTSSNVPVCAGLNVVFTPVSNTRGLVTMEGSVSNDTGGAISSMQIAYGTGTPPANGTLVTDAAGMLVGASLNTISVNAGDFNAFSASAIIAGLATGTAYWVDIAYCAPSGGTAQLSGITVTAFELLDPLTP